MCRAEQTAPFGSFQWPSEKAAMASILSMYSIAAPHSSQHVLPFGTSVGCRLLSTGGLRPIRISSIISAW